MGWMVHERISRRSLATHLPRECQNIGRNLRVDSVSARLDETTMSYALPRGLQGLKTSVFELAR
jgi:hypothetical protein